MARLGVRNRPPVGSAPTVRDCDDPGAVSDIDHPADLQSAAGAPDLPKPITAGDGEGRDHRAEPSVVAR